MNYREKMKEYLKEPDEYSSQWGKWGILNKEQRTLIKRLLKEMDSADAVIKNQFEEIERLTISLQAQEELTMIWYNKVVKIRKYIKEWQSFPHTNGSTHKELKNLMEIIDCAGSDKE